MHPGIRPRGATPPPASARADAGVKRYDDSPPDLAEVARALAFVSPDDRDTWVRMGLAINAEFGDGVEAFDVWDTWSRGSASYRERDAHDVWRSCRNPRGVTIRSLFGAAREGGYRPDRSRPQLVRDPARRLDPVDDRRPWDDRLQALWDSSVPLRGTIGEHYLLARGCAIPPADGDVRFNPCVWHWQQRDKLPALVSRITNVVTGAPMSLHYTFLAADGKGKADIANPRLFAAGYAKGGGCVRAWPDSDVDVRLGIGEGIETVLSIAYVRPPVWACLDTGNLATFPVLDGIEALTIVADNDENGAGQRAAEACATRWHEAGRAVDICMSPVVGEDLNDVVQR